MDETKFDTQLGEMFVPIVVMNGDLTEARA